MSFTTKNPATGQILKSWEYFSDVEILKKTLLVRQQFEGFKSVTMTERSQILMVLAQALRDSRDDLARSMANEMGKPISQGLLEIEKCAKTCEVYADLGPTWLEQNFSEKSAGSRVLKQPLGLLLGIMPWNFPLWQILRFMIPQFIVGNGVLIKPSDIVSETSEKLEKIIVSTVPEFPYANIRCSHAQAEKLMAERWVRGVSLTGSVRAGSRIAQIAGQNIKKVVLELGGSDPYLVLEDAEVKWAAARCAASRLQNNGQSCGAAKRFIIHEKIYDQFKELFLKELQSFKSGDPLLRETKRGPLASDRFKVPMSQQIKSLQENLGFTWAMGSESEIQNSTAAFFPICVLEASSSWSPGFIWKEEIFGPVACLWKVKNFEEGLQICQNSEFGLGSAIFSKDENRVQQFVSATVSGLVAINDLVQSDPHHPFGGSFHSGFGRELGPQGLFEFTHFKAVLDPQKKVGL